MNRRVGYLQDVRYIAIEHMDKVREGETGNPSRSQPGLPGTGRVGVCDAILSVLQFLLN